MMEVARHVRVLLDGEYVAREVASAVLSPVVLVMACCAAAGAEHLGQHFLKPTPLHPWLGEQPSAEQA